MKTVALNTWVQIHKKSKCGNIRQAKDDHSQKLLEKNKRGKQLQNYKEALIEDMVKYFPLQKPTGKDQSQNDVKIIIGGTEHINIVPIITKNKTV